MAHFSRARPDAGWIVGPPLTEAEWDALNARGAAGIDGYASDTYAPATAIEIAGAGIEASGIQLRNGASVETDTGRHIEHGELSAADVPRLAAGHTGKDRDLAEVARISLSHHHGLWTLVGKDQKPACVYPGSGFYLPLRVHDGGMLTGVTIRWQVYAPRVNAPAVCPRARLVVLGSDGSKTIPPLAGCAVDGFVEIGDKTDSTTYLAGGAVQASLVSLVDPLLIDVARFAYVLEMRDESGAGCYSLIEAPGGDDSWPPSFLGTITHVTISDLRPQ